jgi:hypothetical protein
VIVNEHQIQVGTRHHFAPACLAHRDDDQRPTANLAEPDCKVG